MRNIFFIFCFICFMSSCASKTTSVAVDIPKIPVYVPQGVKNPVIQIRIVKTENNEVFYSFDEKNFIKLKKFLLDVSKNNEFLKEAFCYFEENVCFNK